MLPDYHDELEFVLRITKEVGRIQLKERRKQDKGIIVKQDNTIQTRADRLSSDYLVERLLSNTPNYGILCEEVDDDMREGKKSYWWLIDPLDATLEFATGGWSWGPKVALMYKNKPVLGVVHRPMFKKKRRDKGTAEFLYAIQGAGAFRELSGHTKERLVLPEDRRIYRASVSTRESPELDRMIETVEKYKTGRDSINFKRVPGMKLIEIARGKTDLVIYARDMPISLWDIAASYPLITETGGWIRDLSGNELYFGSIDTTIPNGLIVTNGGTNFDATFFRDTMW
jgi:3'(2'), 5'-bisphosphate nucleotidase